MTILESVGKGVRGRPSGRNDETIRCRSGRRRRCGVHSRPGSTGCGCGAGRCGSERPDLCALRRRQRPRGGRLLNEQPSAERAGGLAPHRCGPDSRGANDYCTVPTAGGTWAGFYYSSDGGTRGPTACYPGTPGHLPGGYCVTAARLGVTNAGDPVQAWDNDRNLYYAGIALNRARPALGSIWVARYGWVAGRAPAYEFTTLVERGTPSPIFLGLFHDKIQLEVDRGADSPHAGNVYVCWARFTASCPNNGVFLAGSSDGGRTFRTRRSPLGFTAASSATSRSRATATCTWRGGSSISSPTGSDAGQRGRLGQVHQRRPVVQQAAVATASSGGTRATRLCRRRVRPGEVRRVRAWSARRRVPGPEPRAFARDCGDGPLACQSGYVFHRTTLRSASPPTRRQPATPTTSSSRTTGACRAARHRPVRRTGPSPRASEPGVGIRPEDDERWRDVVRARRIDPQGGAISTSPTSWQSPVCCTRSGRTAGPTPPADRTAATSARCQSGTEPSRPTRRARSRLVRASRRSTRRRRRRRQLDVEEVPKWPPCRSTSSSATVTCPPSVTTTTSRRPDPPCWRRGRITLTRRRDRPRYPLDGTDGFDVLQCRAANPDGRFGPDTCPNTGGLDQNIYGAVVGP